MRLSPVRLEAGAQIFAREKLLRVSAKHAGYRLRLEGTPGGQIISHYLCTVSSTSRTLRASASGMKGFWRKAVPEFNTPW